MGLLDGELASIVADATSFLFLNATLERDVPGVATDPADPPVPTTVTHTCKAIEDQWSVGMMSGGLVRSGDANVLILANTLSVVPRSLDRIIISVRGERFVVVGAGTPGRSAVVSDPARATWSCRCTR